MTSLITLEGLHALKHASRFGARIEQILSDDLDKALAVADTVAPEIRTLLEDRAKVVSRARFRELTTQPVPTHVLACAERPSWTLGQALPTTARPTILLDDPRNSKNLGAVIRVAAAVNAAGVLVNGENDPFDRMAVRGAAGLQWAVPCYASADLLAELDDWRHQAGRDAMVTSLATPSPSASGSLATPTTGGEATTLTIVGLDADGERFDPARFARPTIFAFGSERTGLSYAMRQRCDQIVSLPMRPQVSSLNLATCVSAVMYLRMYATEPDSSGGGLSR
ncbi:MAG: TrmH family RNA methyltransferase [Propionibacteriaceae bacterium]|jgi:TrmH family RNA methyltransferase|nr:TrmH family RNA methyltransferase [Propionibacteriaceae bacterium]